MIHQKLITEVGRSQRVEVLSALRRSGPGGRTVKELAAHFGMSYMGVKQHCLQLEREGLLDTMRRPKPIGRPELLYRLTPRAHTLFARQGIGGGEHGPSGGARLTADLLEAVRRTYGPAAPEKLLFGVFARWAEHYRSRLADCEDAPERAAGLVRLRDEEGYMASLESPCAAVAPAGLEISATLDDARHIHAAPPPASWTRAGAGLEPGARHPARSLRLVESQSPLEDLLRSYPILGRLERELFERVLGCPVRRQDESVPGVYRCVFEVEL